MGRSVGRREEVTAQGAVKTIGACGLEADWEPAARDSWVLNVCASSIEAAHSRGTLLISLL